MLQTLHAEKPDRLEHVAKRVKHLCTWIDPQWEPTTEEDEVTYPTSIRVWELLPYLSNLESLELHGGRPRGRDNEDPGLEIKEPTPRLRFAKLSGYIPRSVATWVFKAGETLERLELAMLDRPISSSLSHVAEYIPLPHERGKPQRDEAGPCADDDQEEKEDNEDVESDWASLGGEAVVPRPLGGYLSKEPQLPKLKHLYLCQPSESDYGFGFTQYTWSVRAKEACYSDWRKILQACMPTISTLVLEQRPAADSDEMDGPSPEEWMESRTTPTASKELLKMVQEVVEASENQRSLQCVYLYGIFVGLLDDGMPDPNEPSGQFMEFLKGCGIECEARVGKWCIFDKEPGSIMEDWYGELEESEEDEDEMEDGDESKKWDDVLAMV